MIAYMCSRKPMPGMVGFQRGAATLLVAMLLLIATTLLILFTSQTSVTEQRMAANEVRAKQAQAAAQAGLDYAIRYRNTGNEFNAASVFTETDVGWASTNGLGHMRAVFCGNTAAPTGQTCPDDYTTFATDASCVTPASEATAAWVVACGWSDDSAARKRIITYVGKPPGAPWTPANPLTAGGTVALTGNPTVVNYQNNLTIWSGDAVNNIGNNGKTVIRNPSTPAGQIDMNTVVSEVGNGNQVCNQAQAPHLICTTSSTTQGPDVIASDTTLSNLNATQYFQNFFGVTPAEYKNLSADVIVSGSAATSDPGIISTGDIRYWVNGDLTVSGNETFGTNGQPLVLIVDGNLTISGSPTFYGLIYVSGNISQSGSGLVRGAMIVYGDASGNGSLNIIYDPLNLPGPNTGGKVASYPGTWRDF